MARGIGIAAVLLCSGCAHLAATRPERIYDVPVETALRVARQLVLDREGVHVEASAQEHLLVSHLNRAKGTRWVVAGDALGPFRSTVGIYEVQWIGRSQRPDRSTPDTDRPRGSDAPTPPELEDDTWVPHPGSLGPFRVWELDRELAERLDAVAAAHPAPAAEVAQNPSGPIEVRPDEPADAGVEAPAPPLPEPTEAEAEALRAKAIAQRNPAPFLGPPPLRRRAILGGDTPDCELAAEQLDDFIAAGNLVLLGDRLGTREIPLAFSGLVCWALGKKLPVLAAIDLPRAEQRRIDVFLRSDGSEAAKQALLGGAFWHWPYPDGSSSEAVLQLLDRLRQWRAAGGRVQVVALGPGTLLGNPREAGLATRLAEARRAHPEAFAVALAGNAHVTRKPGTAWNPGLLPFGYRLGAADPEHVLALDVTFGHGDGWNCRLKNDGGLKCGRFHLAPPRLHQALGGGVPGVRRVVRFQATNEDGFDGVVDLGTLEASPPAVSPGALSPQGEEIKRFFE